MHQVLEERLRQFNEEYEDPYSSHIPALIQEAGQLLEQLAGRARADALLDSLYAELTGRPAQTGWWHTPDTLTEADVQTLQLTMYLADCHAYAFYGIMLHEGALTTGDCGAYRPWLEEFLGCCPQHWAGRPLVEELHLAVEAREAVDGKFTEEAGFAPEWLAALTGLSLKSVRNLLTPGSGSGLRTDANGRIPSEDARRWLEGRPDFKPSVWQLTLDTEPSDLPVATPPASLDDVLFVPIAKDGTLFTPALRRGAGFTIGPKHAEETVADYREALGRLQRMDRPSWRRPNENGNWGIVTASTWTRKTAAELDLPGEEQ